MYLVKRKFWMWVLYIFVRLNFKNLIDVLLHRKTEDADYQLYELKTSNRLKFPDLWGTNEMFRFCKNSFTLVFLLEVLLFYSVRLFCSCVFFFYQPCCLRDTGRWFKSYQIFTWNTLPLVNITQTKTKSSQWEPAIINILLEMMTETVMHIILMIVQRKQFYLIVCLFGPITAQVYFIDHSLVLCSCHGNVKWLNKEPNQKYGNYALSCCFHVDMF